MPNKAAYHDYQDALTGGGASHPRAAFQPLRLDFENFTQHVFLFLFLTSYLPEFNISSARSLHCLARLPPAGLRTLGRRRLTPRCVTLNLT